MTILIVLILVLAALILMYYFVIRPWHLHWGATRDEITLSLPGDSLVEDPGNECSPFSTLAKEGD
jgi:hypothetical protein